MQIWQVGGGEAVGHSKEGNDVGLRFGAWLQIISDDILALLDDPVQVCVIAGASHVAFDAAAALAQPARELGHHVKRGVHLVDRVWEVRPDGVRVGPGPLGEILDGAMVWQMVRIGLLHSEGRLVEGLVLSRAFRRVCERMHQQSVRARSVVVTRVSIRRKVTDFCDLATEFGSVLLAAERDGAVQRAEGTEGDIGACQLVARILRLVFQNDFKAGRI